MPKKGPTGFFQKKIVQIGSIVAALVAIGGGGAKALDIVDSRYALASEIKPLHRELLEQRKESLTDKREQIEGLQRQRRLSDIEMNQLRRYQDQIRNIDRKLLDLEKGQHR
jgi:hypothetical protein